jgi:hypothetical protein
VFADRKAVAEWSRTLEGQEIEVVIRRRRYRRSRQANKYYWKVVVGLIAECTGNSSLEAHEILKTLFLPCEKDDVEWSSARLSPREFWEYVESIREFARNTLNCFIPDPDSAEPD